MDRDRTRLPSRQEPTRMLIPHVWQHWEFCNFLNFDAGMAEKTGSPFRTNRETGHGEEFLPRYNVMLVSTETLCLKPVLPTLEQG